MSLTNYCKANKVSRNTSRHQELIKKYGDVSIGTDVEFLWFQKNEHRHRFTSACDFLAPEGIFGTDGRSIIGEFRVSPAFDPNVLMELLKRAFAYSRKSVARKIPNPDISPYGMVFYDKIYEESALNESIGTHIHFGNLNLHTSSLCAAMDCLLLPLTKIFEPSRGHYIRSGTGYYGDLSDYRETEYGIEYRSFPSFFDNFEITSGIFALAKVIALECLPEGNIKESLFGDILTIKRTMLYDKKYINYLVSKSKSIVKLLCRAYPLYKKQIDRVYQLAENQHKGTFRYTDFCDGIFTTWDIKSVKLSHLETELLRRGISMNASFSVFEEYTEEDFSGIDFTKMILL